MMILDFFRCPSQLQLDGQAATASFLVGTQGVVAMQMDELGVMVEFDSGRRLCITPMGYGWQEPTQAAYRFDTGTAGGGRQMQEEHAGGDGPAGEQAVTSPRHGRPPGSKNRPK